ncbi:MAG: hypothetical protein L6Q77_08780 [Bacteroidetes bacterium]|nr:hypothetical protein [Bacteroidota bacterium]
MGQRLGYFIIFLILPYCVFAQEFNRTIVIENSDMGKIKIGDPTEEGSKPYGINGACFYKEELYVSNTIENRILKFNYDGDLITKSQVVNNYQDVGDILISNDTLYCLSEFWKYCYLFNLELQLLDSIEVAKGLKVFSVSNSGNLTARHGENVFQLSKSSLQNDRLSRFDYWDLSEELILYETQTDFHRFNLKDDDSYYCFYDFVGKYFIRVYKTKDCFVVRIQDVVAKE